MRKSIGLIGALAWLGLLAMVAGLDNARFDRPALTLAVIALCGFIFALVFAFTRLRWVTWPSLLLSIPVAAWSFVWFFHLIPLLRLSFGLFRGARVYSLLGHPAFQCFSLFVTLLLIFMPFIWGVTCYRIFRHATA